MSDKLALKNILYEILIPLWPSEKGQTRWSNLVSNMLKVRPYGYLKKKTVGQYHLRLDPGDKNDRIYYFSLVGEAPIRLIRPLIRPGDCCIDVGANVGFFSAILGEFVREAGRVYAIEANPSLFDRLYECVSEVPHGPVRVFHWAVTRRGGENISFFVSKNSGWSSLVKNPTFECAERVFVPTITIDEFVEREKIEHIRMLKLDIEGGETDAILGGQGSLKKGLIDLILLEAEPHRLKAFGYTGLEIADLMEQHDFEPIAFIKDDKIHGVSEGTRVPGSFNGDYLYCRKLLSEKMIECIRRCL